MALQEGSEAANLRLRREIIHLKETVEDLQEDYRKEMKDSLNMKRYKLSIYIYIYIYI